MADTLVDAIEPVPPTQRDPEPKPEPEPEPEPAPPVAEPPKRSRVSPLVIAAVAMFILGGATAVALWALTFRYEPTALAHVPAGSNIVVRVEASEIVLFGPVRNHLLPMVLEDKPKEVSVTKVPLAERILDKTGVRLPIDVREVLIATMDGRSFVAIFGGKISSGKFVSGLAEIAKDEQWPGFRLENELLVGPNLAVGQAEDGTIIVGTDSAIVMNALPATEEGAKMRLPSQGAVRFVVAKQTWENLSKFSYIAPEASAFGKVRRGTGSFTLGSSPEFVIRLDPGEGADPATIEKGVTGLLNNLRLLTMLAPDRFGEKEALKQATVAQDGSQVVVRAPWPTAGLERGAAELAARIRANAGLEPGAPPPRP